MTASVRWLHRLLGDDASEFRLGRTGDQVVAEWVGVATLRADLSSTWTDFSVQACAGAAEIDSALLPHVTALLRHLRGEISLHGSSVARGGIALIFLGDTCAGKSTIAAQMSSVGGDEFLSDDMTALDFDGPTIRVLPTETSHRLRPDVASALGLVNQGEIKIRRDAAHAALSPAVLGAVVALRFDESVAAPILRRIQGLPTFAALNRATIRFVLDAPEILRVEFDKLARLAAAVPFYELVRAHGLTNLAPSAALASELLRSTSEVR